jgi:hypothetical protein
MRRLALVSTFVLFAGLPLTAAAELYKYKKPDGTVVYTDNLGQLPAERREHYNKQREQREEKRRELEQQIGKEELARREAEAERIELSRQQMEESERQERTLRIETTLLEIQKKRAQREATRDGWRQKMLQARAQLDKKLEEFKLASEKANSIGIQADFSRLPGQNEELENLRKELERLEREIDALVVLTEETIPEEARKAGIPPGWLR